ncbi:GntR family transcriptional regulator MpaR [Cellvibrio sp. pealriver]|uniref:GntR family transcriptional regulator MpaR n=1 Tax=Cellvibrio sp. pealriver TaxID=1622269 RepID=UPI00066FBD33|nr:GntR family transcriptional regulator MpaR [Cellvibrio sp. pealriver]
MKLYEKLADEIAALIRAGVLTANEKVPSVRSASRTYDVSPATVFEAYYLLESRGFIQARSRSGYFVCAQANKDLAEPEMCPQLTETTPVDVSELVFSVLGSIKDPDIIPLGSAFPSPDLFPLARLARSMNKSLQQMPANRILTDITSGNPHLRRQIALRYRVNGVMHAPEELVITNGALEALNLCLQVVTQPGDLVAIETPTFYAALQILERLQLKAVEIPVHPRDGIHLQTLEDSLQRLPIKACWLMSHFHNPLGASMSDEKKQTLCELLHRHQVPLIEDDVYAELYFGVTPPKPIKQFDRSGLVMHCGSFSKNLAPGYRVGWVSAGRYAEPIQRLKLMTTISPSVPAQAALADYLQQGGYDRHLRKLRNSLEQQQQCMLNAIATYFPKDTRVTRPTGGYFLWVELPEQVDSLQLFSMALAQGISIAPGPIFSATRRFRNCIRLNYGYAWNKEMDDAFATLGKLITSLL